MFLKLILISFWYVSLIHITNANGYEIKGQIIIDKDSTGADFVVFAHNKADQIPLDKKLNKTHRLNQFKNKFSAKILAITKGDVVEFDNLDKVFHNVFSLDKPNEFDAGMYKKQATDTPLNIPSKKFLIEGRTNIFCNIHPNMYSTIFTFSHASFGLTDNTGLFNFYINPKVKGSTYKLVIDSPRIDKPMMIDLDVNSNDIVKIFIKSESLIKEMPHNKKDGTKYTTDDDYIY